MSRSAVTPRRSLQMQQRHHSVTSPFSRKQPLSPLTRQLSETLVLMLRRQALSVLSRHKSSQETFLKYIVKIQPHSYVVSIASVLKFKLGHCNKAASVRSMCKTLRLQLIQGAHRCQKFEMWLLFKDPRVDCQNQTVQKHRRLWKSSLWILMEQGFGNELGCGDEDVCFQALTVAFNVF